VFRSTGLQETKPQSFEFLTALFTGHIFVFFLDRPKPFFLKTQQTKKGKSHFDSAFYSKIPPREKKFSSKLLTKPCPPVLRDYFPGVPFIFSLACGLLTTKVFSSPFISLLFLRQPSASQRAASFAISLLFYVFLRKTRHQKDFFLWDELVPMIKPTNEPILSLRQMKVVESHFLFVCCEKFGC